MKTTSRIIPFLALVLWVVSSGFQLIKTQAHFTVRDDLGNIVAGATVKLYETEDDYADETNEVATGETDEKGRVKFKELKSIPYFVLAEKDDKNNFGGGEKTGKLEENRINKITIVIQ